jgi:hypothetical protein
MWIYSVMAILDGSLILHKNDSSVAVRIYYGKLISEEFSEGNVTCCGYASDMNCVADEMRK